MPMKTLDLKNLPVLKLDCSPFDGNFSIAYAIRDALFTKFGKEFVIPEDLSGVKDASSRAFVLKSSRWRRSVSVAAPN